MLIQIGYRCSLNRDPKNKDIWLVTICIVTNNFINLVVDEVVVFYILTIIWSRSADITSRQSDFANNRHLIVP